MAHFSPEAKAKVDAVVAAAADAASTQTDADAGQTKADGSKQTAVADQQTADGLQTTADSKQAAFLAAVADLDALAQADAAATLGPNRAF
jgi:hypothetical protein